MVTVPVTFCVLFSGIVGPNAASGAVAALVAYVLPATSPGLRSSVVPDRLAGWWLASVFGTIAVLVLSPRPPGDRLRASAARSAAALAQPARGRVWQGNAPRRTARRRWRPSTPSLCAFDSSPNRPTGLAVPDQALANLVESLEWCTTLVSEALRDGTDLAAVAEVERRLFAGSAGVLRDTARLLSGTDVPDLVGNLATLERAVAAAG